jgi:hypothetical protein
VIRALCNLISISTTLATQDSFGSVRSGELRLEAFAVSVTVQDIGRFEDGHARFVYIEPPHAGVLAEKYSHPNLHCNSLDRRGIEDGDAIALLLAESHEHHVSLMIVRHVPERPGMVERIGLAWLWDENIVEDVGTLPKRIFTIL